MLPIGLCCFCPWNHLIQSPAATCDISGAARPGQRDTVVRHGTEGGLAGRRAGTGILKCVGSSRAGRRCRTRVQVAGLEGRCSFNRAACLCSWLCPCARQRRGTCQSGQFAAAARWQGPKTDPPWFRGEAWQLPGRAACTTAATNVLGRWQSHGCQRRCARQPASPPPHDTRLPALPLAAGLCHDLCRCVCK